MAVKKATTKEKTTKAVKTVKAEDKVKAVKVEEPVKAEKCECECKCDNCKCNSNEWLLKSMFYTLISILVFVAITSVCTIILAVDYHNNGKNRNNNISAYSTEKGNEQNNNGQVAQDYDVSMLRADYNKFFNVIHDEIKLNHLENNLHVNLNKKGPNNSLLSFIKMEFFDKGRLFGFVDIFPYDYITQVRDGNVKKVFYDEHYKFMADLKNGVDRDVALSKYFDLYNVSEDKTDILIVGIESFRYNQINYDTLFPLKEIKFENHYYPCPNNSKDFLRQEYGDDFMKVPKIAYNHGFYDALMRYDDVYDVFEKHISRFKEINKKLSSEL